MLLYSFFHHVKLFPEYFISTRPQFLMHCVKSNASCCKKGSPPCFRHCPAISSIWIPIIQVCHILQWLKAPHHYILHSLSLVVWSLSLVVQSIPPPKTNKSLMYIYKKHSRSQLFWYFPIICGPWKGSIRAINEYWCVIFRSISLSKAFCV